MAPGMWVSAMRPNLVLLIDGSINLGNPHVVQRETQSVSDFIDAFFDGGAGPVSSIGFYANEGGRCTGLGACRVAANLNEWAGTTRSSWSPVVISVAG